MNKIDELLQQLDNIAIEYDKYQYGLPLKGFESVRTVPELRNAVKQFLVTELNEYNEWQWEKGYKAPGNPLEYIKEKGYEQLDKQ